jgi:hypothetical protein
VARSSAATACTSARCSDPAEPPTCVWAGGRALDTLPGVSESFTPASPQDTPIVAIEAEEFDALPVLANAPHALHTAAADAAALPDARRAGIVIPAVQAVAVAAGGFVAGAAVVGLVHRRQQRSLTPGKGRRAGRGVGQGSRGAARAVELVQIVGSRSLLVDVHLLGGSGER